MPHECNDTCMNVRNVRASLARGTGVERLARDLKLSESRVAQLAGNYNWDSGSGKKRQICPLEGPVAESGGNNRTPR